jgi:hypothetical protein
MSRKMMIAAAAFAAFSLVAPDGFAQRGGGAHGGGSHGGGFGGGHRGGGFGASRFSPIPATPQFNDPGPQLAVPQPGNPVEQLSPMGNAGQPDSLGIR